MPFLLPDTPVVAWWPRPAPAIPAQDPLGRLAIRRITDATAAEDPLASIKSRLAGLHRRRHRPGLEPDHLLAGAAGLGRGSAAVRADHVGAGRSGLKDEPALDILAGWLASRIDGTVQRAVGELKVELVRPSETVTLSRPQDGRHRHPDPHRPSRGPAAAAAPGDPRVPGRGSAPARCRRDLPRGAGRASTRCSTYDRAIMSRPTPTPKHW